MAYLLDLFTPEHGLASERLARPSLPFANGINTWRSSESGATTISSVTSLVCRDGAVWLQAESEAYHEDSPLHDELSPFTVHAKVKPIVMLDPESSIPIYDDEVWSTLSMTSQHTRETPVWTGFSERPSMNLRRATAVTSSNCSSNSRQTQELP